MRAFLGSTLVLWLTFLANQPAFAERRVALIIGNSAYENVARLGNPANDATAITATLKEAGFDIVDSRRNLKIAEMRRAFREFSDKSRDADVAVVYYAGHGIEVDGTNYLIPVDATLERDLDVYDEAFPLDRILISIEPAKQLRLVILDACRDNPFAKVMKRTIGSRAIGRGLAKVEPNSPNTLIAFASKAGSTASDGDSQNSPFTAALVKHIAKPGLDLRKAFGFVRDDVLRETSNRQEPYVYGSLGGNDLPLVPAKPATVSPPADTQAAVRRDYELALQVGTREVWTAFLMQYPEGLYASLAKGQMSKIAAEEARVAATEKARLAEEEQARLRAEGARQAEQARAAAQAKAAEEARLAAEKAKALEQAKAAAAEQARAAAEKAAAEKAAAQKAAADKLAADKLAADKLAAEKAAAAAKAAEEKPPQQLAALAPDTAAKPALSTAETTRSVQSELRRVGCLTGPVGDEWNDAARRSLELFNKHSGLKLDAKTASLDALDAIKAKPARICPLVCDRGMKADGDRCVKITCGAGLVLSGNDECVKKREAPSASREDPAAKRTAPIRDNAQAGPPKPQAQGSGQIFCNQQGCRPVRPGCRIETPTIAGNAQTGGALSNRTMEVCN